MTKIISRNTTVPTKKSEFFSTAQDNQSSVQIHVLQGEREFAKDNKSLGEFKLDGIPPAARNVPKIEVTFDIDVNGILMVKAKDNSTGIEQSITIEGSSKLSDSDIDRMIAEAEEFAAADMAKRELTQLKNDADSLIYQTKKKLESVDDKSVSDADKGLINDVNADIESLEKMLTSDDPENIGSLKDSLKNLEEKSGRLDSLVQSQETTQSPADVVDVN
jgi:molecular chaperone DnaK